VTVQDELYQALSNPMDLPPVFWEYMVQKWLAEAPVLPISQVFGFSQFTAQADSGQSLSQTFGGGGGSASAAGPGVSNLAAGKYVVVAGADMSTQFGNGTATLTVSPGGLVVTGNAASVASVAKATTLSLSTAGSITSTLAISASSAITCTIQGAWLIALRYGNL
jgi:hypothetical protein